jgi:hypothetical protein
MSRTFLANVPIAPVLASLGMQPNEHGRYPCPKHDDQRPGGNPSAVISRKDPCLLDCWSCGEWTTAAELVSMALGCSLEEGLARALEVAGTIHPSVRDQKPRPRLGPTDLEAELRREALRAERLEVDPVAAFVADRGWPSEMAVYLRTWGWTGGYGGRLVIPHRDRNGVLRGLRWRLPPGWSKSARRGSEFRCLYGVWRLGDVDEVLVFEGEPDVVLGGWFFERQGVGVVGLPSGNYAPRPEDLELLAGRRVIFVYDDDTAGHGACDRWSAALPDAVAVKNMLDVEEL